MPDEIPKILNTPWIHIPMPARKRELSIAWSCGILGCIHETYEGAIHHCELLNMRFDQITTNPETQKS